MGNNLRRNPFKKLSPMRIELQS